MSVSFRVAGAWAELTADGTVAIPATPQAGDRMYLFARWKDFSVTATVTDWTELAEFADGSTSVGNGTGSVKVACWYRDWQSGDTDPTIDFSAAPDNASAVIIVMAKEAADVWLTPVAVTAAMTNWTTTSQSVAASSTTTVLGGGVVMGLIGIRDDTATMARPTNGIDDAGGLVTWNGNYVEAPATHHSTTTGFDGATDLGYRLVSAGAIGVTLRMTGTISAAETGAALWVVQGVEVNLTVADASHGHSAENAALTQVHGLTVADSSHAHTATSVTLTQVHEVAAQNATHSHSADSLTLSQVHSLDVQDTSHAHTAESPTIAVVHHLEIQNANHAHVSDAPTVAVIHNLEVQPTSHGHSAENLLLTQAHVLVVASTTHSHTAQSPVVKVISIVFIDPGGDAVQEVGYFAAIDGAGTASFDNTQQVAGAGSWKFDSEADTSISASIAGVLGASRRVSVYFRYDSVPDVSFEESEFTAASPETDYSGGGFVDPDDLETDDSVYATATPARNSGQGSICSPTEALNVPLNATIDSVKIIYERKYDIDTSIGISRVKWLLDEVEGPDHDNTDMPLADTVVEVDVTNDRVWEPPDFDSNFKIIAEARRGDTDTAHTQSWDYVKVGIVYHLAPVILAANDDDNHTLFSIGLNAKGDKSVIRFSDSADNWFDGISPLRVNEPNRISFSYHLNSADDLDVKVYVNGIEELSIEQASTGGFSVFTKLLYGWVTSPGVDHLCWFAHIYIDDGDDLTDTGNALSTAKLPASINENEWDTTTGTGAVNERPLSETNLRRHNAATSARQTYTLEAADEGDIDISAETLLGYMVWAWAKMQIEGDEFFLVVNGVEVNRSSQIQSTPSLLRHAVKSSIYPANAAGVGARTNEEGIDTYLFECGAVVAYEGPPENVPLLEFQLLEEDSITPASDDVSAENPETYAIQSEVAPAPGATITTTIYATDSAGTPHQQAVIESTGGEESGRVVVTAPGEEVSASVEVVGGDAEVGLTRTLNVD